MLVALFGVFAFAAVAAAAAQAEEAPHWSIGGNPLRINAHGEPETHYITAKIYKTAAQPKFRLSTGTKSISCEVVKLKEGVLLGSSVGNPGTNDEVVEFSTCEVTGNGTGCKVKEPIVTKPIKSELTETVQGKTGSLLVEFKPETGSEFVKLVFETGCTIKETAVTGEVAGCVFSDPNNGTLGELITLESPVREEKSWLVNFPSPAITSLWLIKNGTGETVKVKQLTAFTENATLEGTALILLAKKNASGEFESEETNWSPLP